VIRALSLIAPRISCGSLSYGWWVLGLDTATRKRAFRNFGAAARAYPLSCLFGVVTTAAGPLIVLGLTIPDRATAIIGFIIVGLWLLDVSIVLPIRSARAARRRRDDSR
jgi:hypothetical protein